MIISVNVLMYFLSSIIVLTTRFWGVNTNANVRYIVMAVWALYLLLNYTKSISHRFEKKLINDAFGTMMVPYVIIGTYTIGIWIFSGNVVLGNYTRLCSTLLYLVLSWLYACAGIYFFGKKGIDYLFWAGGCSYTLGSIACLLFTQGGSGLLQYLKGLAMGVDTSANYIMEVHDLTFAMGLFFIYYCFFEDKSESKHRQKVILSMVYIVLGLKRIEILALVVAVGFYYVLLKWGKKIRFRAYFCATVFTIISLGFVFIINTNIISKFVLAYGISRAEGRIGYYLYANKFYSFDVTYLGKGWTWFSRYYQGLYNSGFRIDGHGIAASLHSDILTMFIEIGFPLFIFWIFYMFAHRSVKFSRCYSIQVGESTLLTTIFMFILYLTDNTLTYVDTQMLFCMVPMAVAWVNEYKRWDDE